MTKTYSFYEETPWVRVRQEYYSTSQDTIVRQSENSTALAFDALNAFGPGYQTSIVQTAPAPYAWVAPQFGGMDTSIILLDGITTARNKFVSQDQVQGIAGITLKPQKIGGKRTATVEAVMKFNDVDADEQATYNLGIALKSFAYNESAPEAVTEGYCNVLVAKITNPNGEGYLRSSIVPLKAFLTDNCGAPVENATTIFRLKTGNNQFSCTNYTAIGGGWYNCSWQAGTTMG